MRRMLLLGAVLGLTASASEAAGGKRCGGCQSQQSQPRFPVLRAIFGGHHKPAASCQTALTTACSQPAPVATTIRTAGQVIQQCSGGSCPLR
jgi:hypothetical protein